MEIISCVNFNVIYVILKIYNKDYQLKGEIKTKWQCEQVGELIWMQCGLEKGLQ